MALDQRSESLRQEAEWRRCARDPIYFAANYWKIQHPERGAILFDLRPEQAKVLQVWLDHKLSISLKARQIGWSTLASFVAFWHAFFHDDRKIIMLSRTERDAGKLLAKAKYGRDRLPAWMRARGPKWPTDTQSKIGFDNGSEIESLPATDPARGESAYLIFVDEWAFFPDGDAAWAAIEPAADVGGRIHMLSTANGSDNAFCRMFMEAYTGKNRRFKWLFFSWRASGRTDEWYAQKKASLPDWQLHQEYPSTPEEAFIRSGRPYFDLEVLDGLVDESPALGYLEAANEKRTCRRYEFVATDDSSAPLSVWELPQPGVVYVIGADIAEGQEYGDFSVAHVINDQTGKVAAKWRGHIEPDLFGSEVLWALGWFYNQALIGPEVNNHGYATCVALNSRGYARIYRRIVEDEKRKRKTKKLGWHTSAPSKRLLLDELAAALRPAMDGTGAQLQLLDSETVGELRTFVRDEGGKSHGSPFDDQVMSLGIANQMRKAAHSPEQVQLDARPEWGTLDWLEQEIRSDEMRANDDEWLIGASSMRD